MVGRFVRLRQKHTRSSDQSESNVRKTSDTTHSFRAGSSVCLDHFIGVIMKCLCAGPRGRCIRNGTKVLRSAQTSLLLWFFAFPISESGCTKIEVDSAAFFFLRRRNGRCKQAASPLFNHLRKKAKYADNDRSACRFRHASGQVRRTSPRTVRWTRGRCSTRLQGIRSNATPNCLRRGPAGSPGRP